MSRAIVLLAAAAVLLLLVAPTPAQAYTSGRATFYGNEPWWWSIHHGSCGKGYLWPDVGTGWNVAAMSDRHPHYANSCGRCYEVRCETTSFKDGMGNWLERKGMCKDTEAAVVVTVTDTCPCVYANNAYSNKRWCCGDMSHFDLSVHAFQALTDMKWGVIGIKYRPVDCSYKPPKAASGGNFPGEFPPKSMAGQRDASFYHRFFPEGGYTNSKAGDGSSKVSVGEWLRMAGRGGGGGGDGGNNDGGSSSSSSSSSAQYGRK